MFVRRTVVDPEGFSQAGLSTNRIKKGEPLRPHTEGARETRMLSGLSPTLLIGPMLTWMSLPTLTDLGGEVTDTVGTARVLALPRTPTKTEREEHDVSHVLHRPWCRFCVMGRGLERRHLTQSGDHDDGRPRVFADGYLSSGDATPLLVAKDRRTGMTFAAAVLMKRGGDPSACEMDRWIEVPGSHRQIRWGAQHL